MSDDEEFTRERVVSLLLEVMDWTYVQAVRNRPMTDAEKKVIDDIRTALAAFHWLETAYSRICAGEAEADVLRDCGWERVTDAEALRRDAERYRWLRGEHSRIDPCIKANAKYRLERQSSTWVEIHDLDAAIDAAMKEDKT